MIKYYLVVMPENDLLTSSLFRYAIVGLTDIMATIVFLGRYGYHNATGCKPCIRFVTGEAWRQIIKISYGSQHPNNTFSGKAVDAVA